MNPWWYVAGGAGWILVHFLTYAVALRFFAWARTERGIFLYHAGSFALLLAVAIGASAGETPSWTPAAGVLVLSGHGIYSLSFLELWSLSQGGFSLRLLYLIAEGKKTEPASEALSAELGAVKVRQRLDSLEGLTLIGPGPEGKRLTPHGRAVAFVLRVIFQLTGSRSLNR
jgi:hypothetical protein